MNCTQNNKLMQITPETMVVGVDIGSEVHFARAFDFRGFEFSRKAFRFENTRDGFDAFDRRHGAYRSLLVWVWESLAEHGRRVWYG